jgi:enoyl-CoA hydratase/3-hydroxyacyl-CoA dehydrogenase
LEIKRVAVVGAGDMGHGIAQLFAVAGCDVELMDKYPEMLDKAKVRIEESLQRWVGRGKVTSDQAKAAYSRIRYTKDMGEAVSKADLVVEAVPESLELKKAVLKEASELAPGGAIIASNTSNIMISELAKGTVRPERVVGMHFFNPPTAMKLVEVIPGEKTDPGVVETTSEVSERIGKTPIRLLKDSPAFIANRITAAETLFFDLILVKGIATPPEVDNFAKGQGMPMGPYELADFVGIDIPADSLRYLSQALSPEYAKAVTLQKMVEEKKLGKKTGKGFYDWSSGRANIPDVPPTDKITLMDMFALDINEAVKLIEEGVARPDDIEKAVILGGNRPFGPISVAKDLSNAEVKSKLEELSSRFDCKLFAPAHAIAEGKMRDAIEGRLSPAEAPAKAAAEAGQPEKGASKGAGPVRLERLAGHVAKVVISRPRLNLINGEVLSGLDSAITELWDDPEVRVVVVTGEGTVFSAGFELTQYVPNSVSMMEFARKGERLMKRLTEFPKLTVAVLKGYALGGGLELSLSCDLRVATEDVELRFPELTRGLVPAWSGSQRLPKLVGLSRASSMILTSESVRGRRAYEIGLVSQILPAGDPDEQAVKYATELAATQAPVAVMLAKKLLNKGGEVPADVGLEMEAMAAGVLFGTEDLKEGLSAFLGKRKPEFKGK